LTLYRWATGRTVSNAVTASSSCSGRPHPGLPAEVDGGGGWPRRPVAATAASGFAGVQASPPTSRRARAARATARRRQRSSSSCATRRPSTGRHESCAGSVGVDHRVALGGGAGRWARPGVRSDSSAAGSGTRARSSVSHQ
jgi:hypothetical protein